MLPITEENLMLLPEEFVSAIFRAIRESRKSQTLRGRGARTPSGDRGQDGRNSGLVSSCTCSALSRRGALGFGLTRSVLAQPGIGK